MSSVTLTPSQKDAYNGIISAITSRSDGAVLSAPAGSGKTFLTGLLVKALLQRGRKVAVTAPTHKAVGVLAKRLPDGAETMTVHSLLGLTLNDKEGGGHTLQQGPTSRADKFHVVVVDECSMLDEPMFNKLSNEVNGFLLFVGDASQLPPVKSSVPRSPVFDAPWLMTFELKEIVRQQEGSAILELATIIREQEDKRFLAHYLHEFADGDSVIISRRSEAVQFWNDNARVLAYRNTAVQRYNQIFHDTFYPDDSKPFSVGERVLLDTQHVSQQGFKLHTSAEGTVIGIKRENHPRFPDIAAWLVQILMDRGETVSEFYPDDESQVKKSIRLAKSKWEKAKRQGDAPAAFYWDSMRDALEKSFIPLRLTYASTVHKAQGSTYHTAILDVLDMNIMQYNQQFNQLLYTAVTRPSHQLILAIG